MSSIIDNESLFVSMRRVSPCGITPQADACAQDIDSGISAAETGIRPMPVRDRDAPRQVELRACHEVCPGPRTWHVRRRDDQAAVERDMPVERVQTQHSAPIACSASPRSTGGAHSAASKGSERVAVADCARPRDAIVALAPDERRCNRGRCAIGLTARSPKGHNRQ
jgi:hypothetical protein